MSKLFRKFSFRRSAAGSYPAMSSDMGSTVSRATERIHVHVTACPPWGSGYMTQSGTYKHQGSLMELEIETEGKHWKEFQWITSLRIQNHEAYEFAQTGRKRWLIENEGFNIQKNHRYLITYANSLNYNAMKNHYLITQISLIHLSITVYGNSSILGILKTFFDI